MAVAVFEPMRCSLPSIVSVFGAIAPALLLPVLGGRSGLLRRIFWCWLFPAVPAMFIWDAVVSCLRQWSDQQWRRQLEEVLGSSRTFTILSGWHSQIVMWAARTGAAAGR